MKLRQEFDADSKTVHVFLLALMVFDLFSFKFLLNTPQKHENRNFLKN